MRALLGAVLVLPFALAAESGCKGCARPTARPTEQHLALANCRFDALRVYPLFDATAIAFTPLRFGIATSDGLDTLVSDGLAEEVARTGRAEPGHATIRAITGRRDDLWVVLEGFAAKSSDVLPPHRLLHGRSGKWEAIPMIEEGAIYHAPAPYRGGVISIVRQLGRNGAGSKVVGIGLPPDVDAATLFPEGVWGLHGLDSGHVVADAKSGMFLLGPTDTCAKRLRVPKEGSRSFSGATRARFRVHIDGASYRLQGEELVLEDKEAERTDAEAPEGRFSSFEGHDGELFVTREETHKLDAKATLSRERRPKSVFDCPAR